MLEKGPLFFFFFPNALTPVKGFGGASHNAKLYAVGFQCKPATEVQQTNARIQRQNELTETINSQQQDLFSAPLECAAEEKSPPALPVPPFSRIRSTELRGRASPAASSVLQNSISRSISFASARTGWG